MPSGVPAFMCIRIRQYSSRRCWKLTLLICSACHPHVAEGNGGKAEKPTGTERADALQQFDKSPLGALAVVDIRLSLLNRTVADQLLDVAQATAGFEYQSRGVGDEGAAPGMRRAAIES